MDKPFSAETQSHIRALCESIAHRDQLGDDVQEELRGHIEDKVIAYLDGEEAISEADALLLAREHLGRNPLRPRFVKPLSELSREIAMLAAVTLVSGVIAGKVSTIASLPLHFAFEQKYLWIASLVSSALFNVGNCAIVFSFLMLERKTGPSSVSYRFKYARAWQVAIILLGLAVFSWSLLPGLVWEWYDANVTDAAAVRGYLIGMNFIRGSTALFMCMLWMKQCGPHINHMRIAAAAWAALLIGHGVILKLFGSTAVVVAQQPDPTNIHILETPSGLHISFFALSETNVQFTDVVTVVVFTASVSYALYSFARIIQQRFLSLA